MNPNKIEPEVIEQLFDYLRAGYSLSETCRREGMPDRKTVTEWLAGKNIPSIEKFVERYEEARRIGYLKLADEILDFVKDPAHARSKEAVQHARLQFDAMRWVLAKALPKIYGDKLQVEKNETHTYVVQVPQLPATEQEWLTQYSELAGNPTAGRKQLS